MKASSGKANPKLVNDILKKELKMNIFGIGTDIVNIKRIQNSLKNKNFKKRIFTKFETKICENRANKLIVSLKDLLPKKLCLKH